MNKNDFFNKIEKIIDNNYLQSIIYGIEFNSLKLNNNLINNETIIRTLCACFGGLFDVINNNIKNISYILNENPYLANLSIRYTYLKVSILNDEELDLNDKLLLTSILDLISVYIYINKDTFDTKEQYLNICLFHIKENINIYKQYFKDNNIFDQESSLGLISTDGFLQEFIVIGEIVKSIYEKENVKKYLK